MSKWLYKCEGTAVCDVACGTGKLILTYLELIGYDRARKLISSGNLYLYDFDNVALKICKTVISIIYGLDIADSIHDVFCDFLDKSVILPNDCKVISNPPYAQIDEIQDYWEHTNVVLDSKEYYSSFMEKIFNQSRSAVIITPFSFISGSKFYSLRKRCLKSEMVLLFRLIMFQEIYLTEENMVFLIRILLTQLEQQLQYSILTYIKRV